MLWLWIFLFILGYLINYFAAEFLVEEIIESLERFSLSPVVFGILFLGIEVEESSASLFAAFNGLGQLSMGNLIGNSIIAIVISFALPFLFLKVQTNEFPIIYPLLLQLAIVNILLGFVIPSLFIITGVIGLFLFGAVIISSMSIQQQFDNRSPEPDEQEESGVGVMIGRLVLGLIIITIGGQLLVYSAEEIILETGLSETFFGLIILAFVTNGEEFFLMISALRKHQYSLGLAAQIGKLLWNLTLVYGVAALLLGNFQASNIFLWITVLLVELIAALFVFVRYQKLGFWSSFFILANLLVFISLSILTL